jgi:hypothetical protein
MSAANLGWESELLAVTLYAIFLQSCRDSLYSRAKTDERDRGDQRYEC